MASLKETQQEAIATVDAAKALVDKVLTIMQLIEADPSLSMTLATNPIGFVLQMLEHVGITYDKLRAFLVRILIWQLPALEMAVKAILLTNLKNMVSCSVDPRIPDKYRKRHKSQSDSSTSQEYGIDIDIETIDFLNKLNVSPLSSTAAMTADTTAALGTASNNIVANLQWNVTKSAGNGSNLYFGIDGVTDVYKFARADDFDAFLWFVIHKGHFLNSSDFSLIKNRIDGGDATITPSDTLLAPVTVQCKDGANSTILPGNTFVYADNPRTVSMCIDSTYDKYNRITNNLLVPVSDDAFSVNWYARRADQLGKNIGFGWDFKKNGNTVYTATTRDFGKELAICNLQYLGLAHDDDDKYNGLVNHRIRFTILPKPYVHVPDILGGEPPWRFKRMLFDAEGNYDGNGKYTIPADTKEEITDVTTIDGKTSRYVKFIDPTNNKTIASMNVKSGNILVDKDEVKKHLLECYKGLTVYEFNYDYVMSIKLFDAKVLVTTLLDSLLNSKLGINFNVGLEYGDTTEEIKEIIKEIVNSEDSTVSDCFFEFDNSKYDALLKKAAIKRANQGKVDNQGLEEVNRILEEYRDNAELHEQIDVLNRAITQASVTIAEGAEEEDKAKIHFNFVTDLIEQLTLALVYSVLSPKVLMLLKVNQTLMGGDPDFQPTIRTVRTLFEKDILKAMRSVIAAITKEIRDLVVQELTKLLLKELGPIIAVYHSSLVREQIEAYTDLIDDIMRNCPIIWFKTTGGETSDTQLDNVDYADIVLNENNNNGDSPKTNNC